VSWETLLLLGAGFGFAYGFLLQKGDFCFVSAFRDWFSFRYTAVARGILVMVLTALVGWSLAVSLGWAPLDRLWVPAVGWNSLLGGVLFGLGMAVAGGCASGTLYRCGMGYVQFWITLAAMGLGYFTFAWLYDPWLLRYVLEPLRLSGPVTLYRVLPWPPVVTGLAVFAAIGLVLWLKVGRTGLAAGWREATASFRGPPGRLLRAPRWDTRVVGFLLGLTMVLQFVTMSVWGITTPEARLTALAVRAVAGEGAVAGNAYFASIFRGYPGLVAGPWEVLILAMVVGAAVAAWLGGTFRLRLPRAARLPNAVAGGFLMAFGSRVAPGCNIGNIASGLPALSLHSLVATVGIGIGVYLVTAGLFRFQGARRQARAAAD